jgi:hypothetical protein
LLLKGKKKDKSPFPSPNGHHRCPYRRDRTTATHALLPIYKRRRKYRVIVDGQAGPKAHLHDCLFSRLLSLLWQKTSQEKGKKKGESSRHSFQPSS